MWRELVLTLAAAMLGTTVPACDSEESTTPGGNADADRLARAVCGAYRSCCQKAGYGLEPLAACESLFKQEVNALRSVALGSVQIDPGILDRCIAAYEQVGQECTVTDNRLACDGVFVGTRDQGAPCTNVSECRAGSAPGVCLIPQLADGGRGTGTCRQAPRARAGEPCLNTCASDDDCDTTYTTATPDPPLGLCYEEDGLYCDADACVPHVALGESCTYDEQCGPRRACSAVSSATGTCIERAAAGMACERSSQCQRPLRCVGGQCGQGGVVTDKLCVEGDLD